MPLENTSAERIAAIHAAQRDYFRLGATLPADFRRIMLRRLEQALRQWERRLCDALWQDLRKSPEEACLTELSIVRSEVRNHLRHLGRWMRPERRPSPLKLFPSPSRSARRSSSRRGTIPCNCCSTRSSEPSRRAAPPY